MSVVLYGVFLAIQNVRHREYFVDRTSAKAEHHGSGKPPCLIYHTPFLVL
jgi:Ca2+/H+ antiporter